MALRKFVDFFERK